MTGVAPKTCTEQLAFVIWIGPEAVQLPITNRLEEEAYASND
jgi:hypothetical protein